MNSEFPATIDQQAPNVQEHLSKHDSNESLLASVRTQLTDVSSRLKMLEERYNTLRKTVQLTEQNAIETEKNNFKELKLVSENMLEVKKTVQEVRDKIRLLEGEINNFVPRTEFKTVERYLSFWEPMDFVSRKEVNDFLRKKFKELEEKRKDKNQVQE